MGSYYVGLDVYGNPVAIPTGAPPGSYAGSLVGPTMPVAKIGNSTDASTVNNVANGLLELSALHNSLLVNGQLISTGTGDTTTNPLPTTTVRKPWLDAPDGSIPFDPEISVALPAVGSGVTVVTLTVPQGYDGVINGYNWNFTGGGFVQGSGDIQAQIQRNGAAIRNYDNILMERGSYEFPRNIAPLRIFSLDVITLVVNHLANNLLSGNVLGGFVGYFYPSAN